MNLFQYLWNQRKKRNVFRAVFRSWKECGELARYNLGSHLHTRLDVSLDEILRFRI